MLDDLLRTHLAFAARNHRLQRRAGTLAVAYREGRPKLCAAVDNRSSDERCLVQKGLALLLAYVQADAHTVSVRKRWQDPAKPWKQLDLVVAGGRRHEMQLIEVHRLTEDASDGPLLQPYPLPISPLLAEGVAELLSQQAAPPEHRYRARALAAEVMREVIQIEGLPVVCLRPETLRPLVADG